MAVRPRRGGGRSPASGASPKTGALWEKALTRGRRRVSTVTYQAWLSRTLLADLEGGRATILMPNAFFRDRIREEERILLTESLGQLLHTGVRLSFRLVGG